MLDQHFFLYNEHTSCCEDMDSFREAPLTPFAIEVFESRFLPTSGTFILLQLFKNFDEKVLKIYSIPWHFVFIFRLHCFRYGTITFMFIITIII